MVVKKRLTCYIVVIYIGSADALRQPGRLSFQPPFLRAVPLAARFLSGTTLSYTILCKYILTGVL